jgi:hypothetical protein
MARLRFKPLHRGWDTLNITVKNKIDAPLILTDVMVVLEVQRRRMSASNSPLPEFAPPLGLVIAHSRKQSQSAG